MPNCGSQIILCGLPVRFDTYSGCSHACKYCFVQRKNDISDIETKESAESLLNFIQGKRTAETNWCDWDIPLHWGGLSDPFQPAEKTKRRSLECLKVFAETQYPFVVSTKGKLIIEPEYLELIQKCNCVVQISMVCSKYDILEQGAPTFEKRLEMVKTLSPLVPRVIVRFQPYLTEVLSDVLECIPRIKDAGAYGIAVEGMKFAKKKPGLVKVGADFCYPEKQLKSHFDAIKEACHKAGLKFYCAENRLRSMGDSLVCCGIDGLPGFAPNEFNLCHIANGAKAEPTEKMKEVGTAACFKALEQTALSTERIKNSSFADYLGQYYSNRKKTIEEMFGRKR